MCISLTSFFRLQFEKYKEVIYNSSNKYEITKSRLNKEYASGKENKRGEAEREKDHKKNCL